MTSIQLRPAQLSDEKAIRALIRQARLNPTGLKWQRFLIAEADGNFVGCVQIKPHRDGVRELASLAVIPEWHGQGIGTRLINALLAQERRELYLMCRAGMATYYQRFGFVELEGVAVPSSLRFYYRVGLIFRWLGNEGLAIMRRGSLTP